MTIALSVLALALTAYIALLVLAVLKSLKAIRDAMGMDPIEKPSRFLMSFAAPTGKVFTPKDDSELARDEVRLKNASLGVSTPMSDLEG